MIRIRCRCGEVFHAEEGHVGRTLHCRCGRSIPVRLPPPRREAPASPPGGLARAGAAWRRLRARAGPGPARWTAWAAWGYLAAAMLVAVGLRALGERWWPATVYLFGPRWVILLPLALLVPAAALLRPKLLLPLLAALVVVLFPVMGLRTGWRAMLPGEAAGSPLRMVTLNAGGETWAAERLISRMEEWDAHVAAVQECTPPVAEALGRAAGWEWRRDGDLCLLSRHPVLSAETMDRSHFEPVREAGIGGTGAAVRYRLDVGGRPVRLVNVHLETPRRGLEGLFRNETGRVGANSVSREIESRQVARWAAEGEGPLVVAGDFNLPVESAIYRESWGGLANAFSRAGRGFGHTRYNGWIRVRIDHVLAGPGWRVERAWVGPDVGSDHRPVVADLAWAGGG